MSRFVEASFPPYERVLDEIVEAGYAGTELGDWGYLPTEPGTLVPPLRARGLSMLGALVPVAFADAAAHAEGQQRALRTARLLDACGSGDRLSGPFGILADD